MSEQHESPLTPGRFYGWQPSPPDFRDVMYVPNMVMRGPLPPIVELDIPDLGAPFSPVWNQGGIGSCGPHSVAADLLFAQFKQDARRVAVMPSRLFIYWTTRQLMGTVGQDSGVQNRLMMKALAQFGWCDESRHPYSDSRQAMLARPSPECFEQAATRKITQYLSVPQNLTAMKTCLADGDPFVVGFSVYESFESLAVTSTGRIPMPSINERQIGGHDVLAVGYSDALQAFRIRNSYSPEWGQGGYGWLPYAYATHPQLAGDFWTVKKSALPAEVDPPKPPAPDAGEVDLFGIKFHSPPRVTDKFSCTF